MTKHIPVSGLKINHTICLLGQCGIWQRVCQNAYSRPRYLPHVCGWLMGWECDTCFLINVEVDKCWSLRWTNVEADQCRNWTNVEEDQCPDCMLIKSVCRNWSIGPMSRWSNFKMVQCRGSPISRWTNILAL